MYLLIQLHQHFHVYIEHHLHSIMYLLIQDSHVGFLYFYNHLHSIMYLLILNPFLPVNLYVSFTFHNVSINSRPPTTIISSIVFLLFLSTSFYSPHLISIFLL